MLDWFSDWRLKGEREERPVSLLLGGYLPDYDFMQADGNFLRISAIRSQLVLVFLPTRVGFAEAQLLLSLKSILGGVCTNQIRFLVVTRPQYLCTVVALSGDLLIAADESGRAMIDADAGDSAVVYVVDAAHKVISRYDAADYRLPLAGEIMRWVNFLSHPDETERPLWPAKRTARL
jgi:hypothetical protein